MRWLRANIVVASLIVVVSDFCKTIRKNVSSAKLLKVTCFRAACAAAVSLPVLVLPQRDHTWDRSVSVSSSSQVERSLSVNIHDGMIKTTRWLTCVHVRVQQATPSSMSKVHMCTAAALPVTACLEWLSVDTRNMNSRNE
jgi:hypothetical protein